MCVGLFECCRIDHVCSALLVATRFLCVCVYVCAKHEFVHETMSEHVQLGSVYSDPKCIFDALN